MSGPEYGPAFRQLVRLHLGEAEVLAAYRHTTDAADTAHYVAHPALLDGALQACVPLAAARAEAGEAWLPASFGAVRVWRSPSPTGLVHVRDRTRATVELCFDIFVTDPDGSVTVELDGVRMRRLPGPADRAPKRYETVLRAAPHLRLPAAPSPLPGNQDLADAVAGSVDATRADARAVRSADFMARLKPRGGRDRGRHAVDRGHRGRTRDSAGRAPRGTADRRRYALRAGAARSRRPGGLDGDVRRGR